MQYRNPILYMDLSDPDVIRVGEDFYMTASSFTCVPGLPVLHSRDLVHWEIIGHAADRLPHPRCQGLRAQRRQPPEEGRTPTRAVSGPASTADRAWRCRAAPARRPSHSIRSGPRQ